MLNNYISVNTGRANYEVADVLRSHLAEYKAHYRLTAEQARVCGALMACRTAELGGHVAQCSACGALQISYNSCRDRHCPKCCKYKKAQWVVRQEVVLLPAPYFHVVFTVDHLVNEVVSANRRLIYNLLFEAAPQTLKAYGQRYLGGEVGITAVLHTWGQKLDRHVHLHCVVTGGALSADGERWQGCVGRFLFPIVALSAAYRDRFCQGLRGLIERGEVQVVGQQTKADMNRKVEQMAAKAWQVYANYFEGPQPVYEYLSRYVHQVALSNYRIVNIGGGKVTFTYRDNHDKDPVTGQGKEKTLSLGAVEFIRRFLWHVLPARFVRIRHYGLHHSSARKGKLSRCRALLGLEPALPPLRELGLREWLETFIPQAELDRCPFCQAQRSMVRYRDFAGLSLFGWLVLSLLGLKGYRRAPL